MGKNKIHKVGIVVVCKSGDPNNHAFSQFLKSKTKAYMFAV